MVNNRDKDINQRIDLLQQELEELRLAVTNRRRGRRERENDDVKVGDKVAITNNIRRDQEREGTITRYNKETRRVTVTGKRTGQKIIRDVKNVRKIQEFS